MLQQPSHVSDKYLGIIITLAKKLCFTRRLSVCLLATSRKKYSSELHENFAGDEPLETVKAEVLLFS